MPSFVWPSILLSLIAGAAIERSNVCLVRGAASLARGKPEMAAGILLITTSATVVYYTLTVLMLHHRPSQWAYPTAATIAGAVLFAFGSILNGACAVGTVDRIARGDLGHLATFVGALSVGWFFPRTWITEVPPGLEQMGGLAWLMVLLAFSAAILAMARRHIRWWRLLPYIALGIVAAIVTDWRGNWTWTTLVQNLHADFEVKALAAACIVAVLVGAAITAYLRGQFALVRPNPRTMLRELVGGGLMVAGALLIPGANDALSVYGVPSGSPDLVVAYCLMFAIMFVVFRLSYALFGVAPNSALAAATSFRTARSRFHHRQR